jgi:hypothetical protein
MMPEPQPAPSATSPVRSKGGRPKKRHTSVVNVRIPDHIYDAYCKTSHRTDIDVRTIMRQVLTFYAPKA